jgi:hypothetical protein
MTPRASLARGCADRRLAAAAIITFALGVGGVTAIASVVNAVLLRPLPWRAPQELVNVYLVHPTWRQLPAAAALWDRGGLSDDSSSICSRTRRRLQRWAPFGRRSRL